MKKYIFLGLFVLFTMTAKTQSNISKDSSIINNYIYQNLTGEKYNDPGYKHVNIYFKDYWIPGTIQFDNGEHIENIPLKYNGSNNQLVMLSTKFGQIKIDDQNVTAFQLNDKSGVFKFKKIWLDTLNINQEIYCQFIYKNKMEVYVYRRVKSDAINYRDDGMYRIYSPNPLYILFINNRTVFLDKAYPKALIEQFPELKQILKEKNRKYQAKTKFEVEFYSFLRANEDILVDLIK